MKIRDAMTREVWTCRPDEPALTAARLMWEHDVGALPVTEAGGALVGIVTGRDISMRAYIAGEALAQFPVATAMSHRVFTIGADEPLAAAEQVMRSKMVRRLPVVEDGKVVGMLSLGDVTRAEAAQAGAATTDELTAMMRVVAGSRLHFGKLIRVHEP
jgi:CBS domain-containing protein